MQLKAHIDYVIGDKELGLGDDLSPQSGSAAPNSTPGGSATPVQSAGGAAGAQQHRVLPEETNAPWGLDSIDQSSLPLDGKYDYDNMGGLTGARWGAGRCDCAQADHMPTFA